MFIFGNKIDFFICFMCYFDGLMWVGCDVYFFMGLVWVVGVDDVMMFRKFVDLFKGMMFKD